MWQQIIVGLIVAAALLHFCTKYLPAAWRRQIVFVLTKRGFNQDKLAKLFKTESSCGDGCGSCGSCGDAPAEEKPVEGGPARRVIKLHVQR
ncbi:DUF6587 family protein [Pseudoduganella sp. RAF53_2]|uniref:DUF6587 family protein n=1 Tax=unclassified Pseudoduganella TaxID=2637179 RepID=UPI003F94FD8D